MPVRIAAGSAVCRSTTRGTVANLVTLRWSGPVGATLIRASAHRTVRRRSIVRFLTGLFLVVVAAAQSPAVPVGNGENAGAPAIEQALEEARALLKREDPVSALSSWQRLATWLPRDARVLTGLGRTHLTLGRAQLALVYAEAALAVAPRSAQAHSLRIDALLRARHFERALALAREAVRNADTQDAALLASLASALFRMQQNDEAAAVYRRVLQIEPRHAEAHLRLGSGLMPPAELEIPLALREAVAAGLEHDRKKAQVLLTDVLGRQPDHAVAHRLLGESLLEEQAASTMAFAAPEFRSLVATLPRANLTGLPVELFLPGHAQLDPERAAVAGRSLMLFSGYLDRLVAMGGRHDLLAELERTTDAPSRRSLRGKRTFDGRVWDDVRGMGGLQAATGIEALDEASGFGFDTLAHEMAHQVHLYVFSQLERRKVRDLYRSALENGRCLDYYAASNEAEYFAQGVEAFACLAKRPGRESTHGHTRFELLRVDPELHEFVKRVVSTDVLRDEVRRNTVLAAAIAAALRSGRASDAVIAAGLMDPSDLARRLEETARAAELRARVY